MTFKADNGIIAVIRLLPQYEGRGDAAVIFATELSGLLGNV